MKLQSLVNNLAKNPNDINNMFELAEEYTNQGQYSAAYTYYLHCLELANESEYILRYHCMMMIAWIYYILGNRLKSVFHFCKLAKAECPDRPEAYYLYSLAKMQDLKLSNITEQWDWVEVYESSRIGTLYAKVKDSNISRYYDGLDSLKVIYLESLIKINKLSEAREFLSSEGYSNIFVPRVFNTLTWAFNEFRAVNPLTKLPMIQLAQPVKDIIDNLQITNNYAKSFEDIFAIIFNHEDRPVCMHYTDSDPNIENNTKLLRELGWEVDYYVHDDNLLNEYKSFNLRVHKDDMINRYNSLHHLDLSTADPYGNKYILEALIKEGIHPSTVVFRHDLYKGNGSVKSEVEEFMYLYGYKKLVNNVRFNMTDAYEDWYYLPNLIASQTNLRTLIEVCSKSDILCNDIFH